MNTQNTSSKKTFIIIIVIVLIAIGYYFYSKGGESVNTDSLLSTQEINPETQIVGSKVLSLLNQISSLKIDPSLFTSASYKSLVDYTIAVPEQNIGRPNPFAPLNGPVKVTNTTKSR